MSGKRNQSKSNRRNKLRIRLTYAASILVLTALVGVAFFSPGWFFGFQDSRRCRDTTLEERENVNAAALSTNYESSFYQRMVNFAENQEDANYYVASEELTDYDKLQNFLYSEDGLYSDCIGLLISAELITNEIFDCQVTEWKQYVIYSDDYAKGVNYILWYIELENADENIGTYKLLLEADTGELYGLKADTGGTYFDKRMPYDRNAIYYDYSLDDYLSLSNRDIYDDAWMELAYFYSGLAESDFFEFYELYYRAVDMIYGEMGVDSTIAVVGMNSEDVQAEIQSKLGITDGEYQWLNFLRTYPAMSVWDGGNRLECNFPYGEGSLNFRMQMAKSVPHPWTLRDITIGFPAIYELIPEFG